MLNVSGKSTFVVDGRKIKIVTGEKTQTVNVCDHTNEEGAYAFKVRIHGHQHFVTTTFLEAEHFNSIPDLLNFLTQWPETEIEEEGDGTLEVFTKRKGPLFSVDEGWTEKIIPDVEQAINRSMSLCRTPTCIESNIHCIANSTATLSIQWSLERQKHMVIFPADAFKKSGRQRIRPVPPLRTP